MKKNKKKRKIFLKTELEETHKTKADHSVASSRGMPDQRRKIKKEKTQQQQ